MASGEDQEQLLQMLRGLQSRAVKDKVDLEQWYREARNVEKFIGQSPLGTDVPHELWHYLADADIRLKDPDYAEIQNRFLAKFLDSLDKE